MLRIPSGNGIDGQKMGGEWHKVSRRIETTIIGDVGGKWGGGEFSLAPGSVSIMKYTYRLFIVLFIWVLMSFQHIV